MKLAVQRNGAAISDAPAFLPPLVANLVPAVPPGMPPAEHAPSVSEGPRSFTAPLTPLVKPAGGPPVTPEQTSRSNSPAYSTGPALVTASGNKVWIRLDERRTVTLEKGQPLEGYGAFIGVEKGVAKFERGSVASKVESADVSSRN